MTVETSVTIDLSFENSEQLKQAYLPFLINGGIIIPAEQDAKLGDIYQLTISLLDNQLSFGCQGKVVWVTQAGAQIPSYNGTGVEFIGEPAKELRAKIELYLAGS